jgi:hypothetical protein
MCVMRGLIEILHHRDKYVDLMANSRGAATIETG